MSWDSLRDVLVPWFPRLEELDSCCTCAVIYQEARGRTSQGVVREWFEIMVARVRSERHLVFWHFCIGIRLTTMCLSFSIIYLFSHSAKFAVSCCQSNTNRFRVFLKIFGSTKMVCTQTFPLKIEESPEWMTPGGRGYSKVLWEGRCSPGVETLTLFKTQFSFSFSFHTHFHSLFILIFSQFHYPV